jgi:predicted XRE-type DNA-binding protein
MDNPFFYESNFRLDPIIKPVDAAVVEKDIESLRQKILECIREQVVQKDLDRREMAMVTRMTRSVLGPIVRGQIDKVSTDRLLRVAGRLGIRAKIKLITG